MLTPPTQERGAAQLRSLEDDERSGSVVILDAPGERAATDPASETPPLRRGVVVVVAAAVLFGLALRAWFLFHASIDSDQAIVGLMAHNYLHGHLTAFYWGQQYGGLEAVAVAAMFRVGGESVLTLSLTAVLFSALSAVLVWRITRRMVGDRNIAILAGALAWAAPLAAVFKSTDEYGLRGATLACGLGMVLFAVRILDRKVGVREFVALGLLAGLGWWSLPEIVYFALPAALLVAGAIAQSGRSPRWWAGRLGAAILAATVGALPWLWANVNSGFASLDRNRFPGTSSPLNTGYTGRLSTIFRKSLPTELGLRPPSMGYGRDGTSRWVLDNSSSFAHALLALFLIAIAACIGAALVLCVVRGGRALAMAVALVALPFLAAAQPGTWWWQDGRYLVYLGPLLTIVLAIGCEEAAARWASHSGNRARLRSGSLALGAIVTIAVSITMLAFHVATRVGPSSFDAGWSRPDGEAETIAATLHERGIRYAYANYWVAYKLDFLSHGHLTVTVGATETDRSKAMDEAVRRADTAAWLFVPASQSLVGYRTFGATDLIRGPDGLAERVFLDRLDRMHVGYRIVHAGPIDAVLPERQIAPESAESA